jgi:hypothetical protein
MASTDQFEIVLKSASQQHDDYIINNCDLNWSIKQLKHHLSDNYYKKPSFETIRLIYSGKLLHDHSKLNDCIRHVIFLILRTKKKYF